MKTASWVIVRIATNEAILETFNQEVASSINTEKYRAIPIMEYLGSINKKK